MSEFAREALKMGTVIRHKSGGPDYLVLQSDDEGVLCVKMASIVNLKSFENVRIVEHAE